MMHGFATHYKGDPYTCTACSNMLPTDYLALVYDWGDELHACGLLCAKRIAAEHPKYLGICRPDCCDVNYHGIDDDERELLEAWGLR